MFDILTTIRPIFWCWVLEIFIPKSRVVLLLWDDCGDGNWSDDRSGNGNKDG